MKSPKTEGVATINEDARKLGFGEYDEWGYVEVIASKRRYVQDLLGETNAQSPEKKRFVVRIRRKGDGITTDVNTGEVEWEAKNMPTVGEEFGFLIIPRWYQEGNHFGECYQ